MVIVRVVERSNEAVLIGPLGQLGQMLAEPKLGISRGRGFERADDMTGGIRLAVKRL